MVSLTATTFIGLILETLFYGIFLIVFGISVNLQWGRYRRGPLTFGNKLVFAFSILLSLFITTHWWLNLYQVYEAFLQTQTPSDREMYLANLGVPPTIAKFAVYEIQMWMGDALLIYRFYHVAGRKLVVIIPPALMCCALITCGSHSLYYGSRIDLTQPQTLPAILQPLRGWSIAGFCVSVSGNIYCLALISFFIWRAHRDVRETTTGLQSVLQIIIESAGIWVFFISLAFIIFLINETACYIFLYLTSPVLGICFCMMIIRLQSRNKVTTVGSSNFRPSYISTFVTTSKERTGSGNTPNELMVFSSKRTAGDSAFDTTDSRV